MNSITIKVDRIASVEEFELLCKLGVDIFGFTYGDDFDQQRWIDPAVLCRIVHIYPDIPYVFLYDSSYHDNPQLPSDKTYFIQSAEPYNPLPQYPWIKWLFNDLEDSAYVIEQVIKHSLTDSAIYRVLQVGYRYTQSWQTLKTFSYAPELQPYRQEDEFLIIDELKDLRVRYPNFLDLEWTTETMHEIAMTFGPHARYNFTLGDPDWPTHRIFHSFPQVLELIRFLKAFDFP